METVPEPSSSAPFRIESRRGRFTRRRLSRITRIRVHSSAVVSDRTSFTQARDGLRPHDVEEDRDDRHRIAPACTTDIQAAHASTGRDIQNDDLARYLRRRDPAGRIVRWPSVDRLHAIERPGASGNVRRNEITTHHQRSAIRLEARLRIDSRVPERNGLEVRAVLTGRLEPEPTEFRGHVVRRLGVAQRARLAPHHGVVRNEKQALTGILWRDRHARRRC